MHIGFSELMSAPGKGKTLLRLRLLEQKKFESRVTWPVSPLALVFVHEHSVACKLLFTLGITLKWREEGNYTPLFSLV